MTYAFFLFTCYCKIVLWKVWIQLQMKKFISVVDSSIYYSRSTHAHNFVFFFLHSFLFIFFFYLKRFEILRCETVFIIACYRKKTRTRANDSISTPYTMPYVIGCTFPISIDLAVVNIYDAISILTLVRSWNHWLINIYSSICVLCEHILLSSGLGSNFLSIIVNVFEFYLLHIYMYIKMCLVSFDVLVLIHVVYRLLFCEIVKWNWWKIWTQERDRKN